jgi:hypothetical protein
MNSNYQSQLSKMVATEVIVPHGIMIEIESHTLTKTI